MEKSVAYVPHEHHTVVFTVIGPSSQLLFSADGTVTFEAGSTSNSTSVFFNISDDEVALEPPESYDAVLTLLQSTTSVRLGSPSLTTVYILEDDSKT